jgi:hypothetical protein
MAKQQEVKAFKGTVKEIIKGNEAPDPKYGTKYVISFEDNSLKLTKGFKDTVPIKAGDIIKGEYKRSWGDSPKGDWEFFNLLEYENLTTPGSDTNTKGTSGSSSYDNKTKLFHEVAYVNATALASACDITTAGTVKTVTELKENYDSIRLMLWNQINLDYEELSKK